MNIKYFKDTDTLFIVFNENAITETSDISENVLADLDKNGNLVSLTVEHAQQQTNIFNFAMDIDAKASGTITEKA